MSLKEKLKRNDIRDCIDTLLIFIPLMGLEIIPTLLDIPEPNLPAYARYSIAAVALAAGIDIVYRIAKRKGYEDNKNP